MADEKDIPDPLHRNLRARHSVGLLLGPEENLVLFGHPEHDWQQIA